MSIEFEGMKELLEALEKPVSDERINEALAKGCMIIERRAKELAPKGNGDLRRSITSKVENLEGIVYTPLEYAPYVEYGTGLFAEDGGRTDVPWCYQDEKGDWHTTSGMPPHPYMRPALEQCREPVKEKMKEVLLKDD